MSKKINQKFLEVDEWRVYDLPIQYGEEDYNDAEEYVSSGVDEEEESYDDKVQSLSFDEIVSLTMMLETAMTIVAIFLFTGFFIYTYLYF